MLIENTTWKFRLTPEEKEKLVTEIGSMMRQVRMHREDLKLLVLQEKDKIKTLEKEMRDKLDTLTAGEEQRPANLRIEFDRPQPGQKEIYDNDTGELLAVRDMTEDDRQDLFVHAETQEQQPPAEEPPKRKKKIKNLACEIGFGRECPYTWGVRGNQWSGGGPADTYEEAVDRIVDRLNFEQIPLESRMEWTDDVEHTASLAEAIAKAARDGGAPCKTE